MTPTPRTLGELIEHIDAGLDRMVRIEMERLPPHWSEADRREVAEKALFGRKRG